MDFKTIADALTQAAMQTDFRVTLSRSNTDADVIFTEAKANGEYHSELFGICKQFGRVEFRALVDGDHIIMNQAEFISELQERFKAYGVDFGSIIERTAA